VFNSLAGIWIAQIAVAVLAVLAITSEYATGTIRATFAANPRRLTVLAAKAAAVGAVVAGVGLAASFASYRLGQSILPGNGYTPANGYPAASLGDGATLRAVVGSGLYLVVLALFCLGIGTIVRHTAGAITTVLGLLLFPFIASIFLPEHLGETVQKFSPMIGLVIQSTVEDGVPLGPWEGFGVTCAYAGASLLLAFWLIRRRDA
jgi:ABC-2 type transport system permease protein